MFDSLFGWPKASKCKKTIKRARCRLRQLKSKRLAIARQLRKDLAELLQNGHEDIAVKKVEQLIQDESIVVAYELLDHFCEFILKKLSFIKRHKDCPDDINEAVSSLIFASARCGDLPELYVIRKLFRKRYGEKFETAAVEQLSGNLVNQQLKENLSVKSVPDDLKYRMVDEIIRDNCLQPKVLAIEYYPDWQQSQVEVYKGHQLAESDVQISDTSAGSKIHPSEDEEIERDVICVNSSISNTSNTLSLPESSCLTDTSALVPTVQQCPLYLSYPLQKKEEKEEDFAEQVSFANSDLQNKGEVMALVSSAERLSLPRYAEAMVDYVDDIEGYHFSLCQSQSGTKKKSFNLDMYDCSLDQPCYCCVYNDQDCLEALPMEPNRGIIAAHIQQGVLLGEFFHCQSLCHDESHKGMELVTVPHKPNRESSYSGKVGDHLLTYPDYHSGKPNKISSSLIRTETAVHYSRALSMPPEWPKNSKDKILRTYSYSPQQPKHVHPKLPDYEDIYAKFTALKRKRQENKDSSKEQQLK